ncbi:ubp1-associated protein 2a [Phtheirospermum japonicum]|uniref:Ubp1-associated protein 2a n=1 Tax=Phtheirospermum japonicum TaxID=374723 RepID=A0A830B4S4_9LAMI|nr:ubp1-associated protein 2a [Phtheirospermum japonicum]
MVKKRKAPSSQQTDEQKPKTKREEVVEEEEKEEISDEEEQEESSSEEEESESEAEEEENESSSSEEEPKDDASKRVTQRQLLEPFPKSKIIDLLKQAIATDPKILPKITQVADSDPAHRKIFVHGLGWDATSDQLLDTFKPFGEIEDSKLVTDHNTGRAKGYAFVLFKTRSAAKKALKVPQKQIGSRMVSCQLAAIGPPTGTAAAGSEAGSRKIYIGNVGPQVSPENLKAFFRRFGEIEDVPLGNDPVTNKFKGFAIITYKSPEGYNKAMEEPIKVFENCQLHCKKFVENLNKNNNNGPGQSGPASVSPVVADVNYGGLGANLNSSGLLIPQNAGMGLVGPAMLAAGYNFPAGFAASPMIAGMGGNYGMMGNYGPQAGLQGMGAFQNAQAGQSAIGTAGTITTPIRGPTSGVPAPKAYTSYFSG